MTEQGPSSNAPWPRPQPSVPPPMQASPLPYAQMHERSKWPMIVGILAIVLGAWGILGAAWQAVALLLASRGTMPNQPTPFPPEYMVPAGVVALGLSILTLACGIGLVRRRRWSVAGLRVWAVLTLLSLVVNAAVTMSYLPQFLAEVEQQMSATGGGPPPGFMKYMMIAMMAVGFVIGLTPPVFMLIWFGRQSIRQEVAGWK